MIEIVQGDCLDLDPEFFENFDLQCVDPPYSPYVHDNCASVGVAGGGLGAHDRDLEFDALSPELRDMIAACAASVRGWSCIFSDVESLHTWIAACEGMGAEYVRPMPWIRWSQPQLSGDRPCTTLEIVSTYHRMHVGPRGGRKPVKKAWNGPGNPMPAYIREVSGVLGRRALRGQDKHPTEKGLDLILDLVSWFSNHGESVIDLCAGSGTTALACRLLGRDCLAYELKSRWARQAAERARGLLSARDRARAEEWCELTAAEAQAQLDLPPVKDDADRNTRARADRRLEDVERVLGAL